LTKTLTEDRDSGLIEDRDSGSTEARDSGQSNKFSVVIPIDIEGLSIKQRVSFGQRL
jgi:hypothetical protein